MKTHWKSKSVSGNHEQVFSTWNHATEGGGQYVTSRSDTEEPLKLVYILWIKKLMNILKHDSTVEMFVFN